MAHEGWKNYETWAVALMIDNDRVSHDYWRGRARYYASEEGYKELRRNYFKMSREEVARYSFADALKRDFEARMPELDSPYSELLRGGFDEVDWDEIAVHLLEQAAEG